MNIREVKVYERYDFNDHLFELVLKMDTEEDHRGTFIMLSMDGKEFRPFSVSSNARDHVRLCIKKVGKVTEDMFDNAHVGEKLYIKDKFFRSSFPVDIDLKKTRTFIAMGVGATPFFSYIHGRDLRGNSTLLYSMRHSSEMLDWYGGVDYKYFITREECNGRDFGDIIWGRRINADDIPQTDEYFICGSKVFADSMKEAILSKYPGATIYMEAFG